MENTQTPQPREVAIKKDRRFLFIGIMVAIINIVLRFTKFPFLGIVSQITAISIFVSIVLLFMKKYRNIARQYLIGLWGTLLGIIIVGFTLTLILVAIKK